MSVPLPARRLHPWSWLFHAARVLGELLLPLVILVVLHRDEHMVMVGAGAVVVLACVYGWVRARSFRYEVLAEEIVIREGVFTRESRQVPFSRIQAVSERRGLMHRFVDVTELVLESGSGGRPEAVMKVLYPRDAARLAELLRHHRAARAVAAEAGAGAEVATDGATTAPGAAHVPAPTREVLLSLPAVELVKLGLVSNRGLLVLAMGVGVVSQNAELLEFMPGADRLADRIEASLGEAARASIVDVVAWLLVLMAVGLAGLRILSIGHALFTQYGFTLLREGDRLRVQRGLLTRVDVSGRVSAVQRLQLERTLLHRLFGRCSLRVELPVTLAAAVSGVPRLDHLAPIASPTQAQALIQACLPGFDAHALCWQPLHPGAAARRWQRTLTWLLPLLACGAGLAWALPGLPADTGVAALGLSVALLAASAWHARAWARSAGYAVHHGVVVWRSGVLTQRWVLLPEARVQAVVLRRSPRDRRAGTATLCADSMAAVGRWALPWLADADAVALRERLWRAGTAA